MEIKWTGWKQSPDSDTLAGQYFVGNSNPVIAAYAYCNFEDSPKDKDAKQEECRKKLLDMIDYAYGVICGVINDKVKVGYVCGGDWLYELGEVDMPGPACKVFNNAEQLIKHKSCTDECGIVEIEIRVKKWVKEPSGVMA